MLCVLNVDTKVVIVFDFAITFFHMRPSHRHAPGFCAQFPGGSPVVVIINKARNSTSQCDHYSYLSDGHHGHRSGQEVEKMKQRPNCDREPLLPIRQIAHIVDKSIRKEKMLHAKVALVEKMMSYGWFRDIYNAASSFYATIM